MDHLTVKFIDKIKSYGYIYGGERWFYNPSIDAYVYEIHIYSKKPQIDPRTGLALRQSGEMISSDYPLPDLSFEHHIYHKTIINHSNNMRITCMDEIIQILRKENK